MGDKSKTKSPDKREAGPTKKWTAKEADELIAMLRKMPEKPPEERPISKQQVVRLAAPEIRTMQAKGYTLVEIAELFTSRGFDITTPTLKNLLARTPADEPYKKRRKKNKNRAQAQSVAATGGNGTSSPVAIGTGAAANGTPLEAARITGGENDNVD